MHSKQAGGIPAADAEAFSILGGGRAGDREEETLVGGVEQNRASTQYLPLMTKPAMGVKNSLRPTVRTENN